MNGESVETDFAESGASEGNVFDAGNVLVGQDAQFDGNGDLVDPGTVDVNKVLENPGGYGSWADALDAGDVVAVKPSDPESGVKATDPIVKPKVEDPSTGEMVDDPSTKPVGDGIRGNPNTPTRLGPIVESKLSDLGDKVSDKFPFSIPANISAVVDKFKASPEAPRFTWVFDVPTGREELEVDLSDYSPVATVLRAMLNVALLFGCVTLLVKIAELFNLVNGE